MEIKKNLIKRKENSEPNTEFEIQDYEKKDNKWIKYGNVYNRNEYDIIKDIKKENGMKDTDKLSSKISSKIYSTFSEKNNTNYFTIVDACKRETSEYLKSENNYSKNDNITSLPKYK